MIYDIAPFYIASVGYCMDFLLPDKSGRTIGGSGFLGKTIEEAIPSIKAQLPTRTPDSQQIYIKKPNNNGCPSQRNLSETELETIQRELTIARKNIQFIF